MQIKVHEKRREEKKGIRNDKIELLRTGEIANTGMCNICWFVSRNHVVPYTHLVSSLFPLYLQTLILVSVESLENRKETQMGENETQHIYIGNEEKHLVC